MAKGRVINKSISLSNKVNLYLRNPLDCLLYTWGLTHADDEGRIEGNPVLYRGRVAPILPGLTDTRVDLALTAMETAHLIIRYTVEGVMVIQFLDWNKHQSFHGYKRKQSYFPPEPLEVTITNSGDNHPLPPLKESKIKESNNTFEQQVAHAFASLWKRYPRRIGKKKAYKHFIASVKSEVDLDNIKKALENYTASVAGKDPQYIQHGGTWFNNWQDWTEQQQTKGDEDGDEIR